MFQISLENYDCKIKITSSYVSDDGLVYSAVASSDDYGYISDEATIFIDLGYITDAAASGYDTFILYRREVGDSTWIQIYTKSVSSSSDLSFVYYDKYTRSRHEYEYKFELQSSDTPIESLTASIECNFDSIYIYDATAEYILSLDVDFDTDEIRGVFFQEPLQSQYPIRIQNSSKNYLTGYVEGLPLPKDSNGNYITSGSYKYKQQYINFLRNGIDKYVKTYEGDAWLVSVGTGIKKNASEYEHAKSIRFPWTQIGATPEYDS